jgi:hypothetical protein
VDGDSVSEKEKNTIMSCLYGTGSFDLRFSYQGADVFVYESNVRLGLLDKHEKF